jgi:hypothetical protein
MESGDDARRERRPSAALVVSIIALAVAMGGTAVAVDGGFDARQTKAIKAIAAKQGSGNVQTVFKRLEVGNLGTPVVAKGAGFKIRGNCQQNQINAYLTVPDGVTVDGVSDEDSIFGTQTPLDLNATGGGFQVSSFAIAGDDGRVMSGNLGFDYPGASGIFNGQNRCVIYGHIVVN